MRQVDADGFDPVFDAVERATDQGPGREVSPGRVVHVIHRSPRPRTTSGDRFTFPLVYALAETALCLHDLGEAAKDRMWDARALIAKHLLGTVATWSTRI